MNNNSYDKALDAIVRRINLSRLHASDQHAVAEMFDYLIRSGRTVGGSDRIGKHLTAKGLSEEIASEIQQIYESIYALHDGGPAWSEELLQSV